MDYFKTVSNRAYSLKNRDENQFQYMYSNYTKGSDNLNSKHIKLKELTNNKPCLFKLISLVSNNVSIRIINNYVIEHYHKPIYASSVGLLRKKIKLAQSRNLSIVDLLNGKKHYAVPLHKVNPLDVMDNEIARIGRASDTNTITTSDKRELIQLLRICMKRSRIDYDW